jgi:cyclic beta-1,2-glucan synthetase
MASELQRALGLKSAHSLWDDPSAIRAVLFSVERLEEHARSVATSQRVNPRRPKGHIVLDRLTDNEACLIAAYQALCSADSEGAAITPAAEWLIDNFHQVERQIRQVRTDLPPRYYRELPQLAEGPFAGLPRVFEIAWAFVAHSDSRFDVDMWASFVGAYQKIQPLSIGELWACAITLRIVLIENLRRIAERLVDSRNDRRRADDLANRLLGEDGRSGNATKAALAQLGQGRLSAIGAKQT